jgi:hypothetical protein
MKKYLFALMAAAAILVVACNKDEKQKEGDEDSKALAQPTYRIKSYSHSGDVFDYSYNADGTVKEISMSYEGKPYTKAVFTYEGNKLTIKDELNENGLLFEMTLDANKHATTIKNYMKDNAPTYNVKYDKNGFLVYLDVNGTVTTLQNIDEDGNVEYWTRVGIADKVSDDVDAAGWRKKFHTYYPNANAAGIHSEWDEDAQVKRWVYETGLLGRASVNVMKTAWWWGVADKDNGVVKDEWAAKLAYYPLNVDANNCIKTELKLYDKKEVYEATPDQMAEDDKYVFVCEKI